ncbi:MAG TPA: MFS transporter [Ktedonobacterales bacterium]|nr:MFS transporter [Ktedonobacterales bacterium]
MSLSTDTPDSQSLTESPSASNRPRRGLRAGPLRLRDFRLLIFGQMVSTVGDMFYAVALPWFVLANGGTPRDLGIVLAAYGIPRAASVLLGGSLSDRVQPRRMMLLADIARALLVGGLAVITLFDIHTLWVLCVIAAPLGAFEGIFLPASMAMLPSILSDDDLQAGNAINMATAQFSVLVGPGVGGVIVASVRSGVAFMVDAITFLVSAASLAAMRGTRAAHHAVVENPMADSLAPDEPGIAAETAEPKTFWALLRQSRLLQTGLAVSIVGNLAFGALTEVALPDLAHGPLHAGATGFGIMVSAFGAGSLVGSLLGATMGKLPRRGLMALLLGLVQALFLAVIPFTGGLPGAAISIAAWGVANAVSNVLLITLIQQRLPRALLGRIMGAFMFANFGLYPISVAVGGVVVDRLGPAIIFPITGGMLFLAILYGLFQPELRDL